jgi:hypothetical protein
MIDFESCYSAILLFKQWITEHVVRDTF